MRRKIDLRVPEAQLQKLLGFSDEMLTMIEADLANLSEPEIHAAKELRHILNKVVNMYREQIEYEPTPSNAGKPQS